MADRHFDLNRALREAEDAATGDDQFLTFDLGPNYQPSRPLVHKVTDPETGEERDEPYPADGPDPGPQPWRITRALAGWHIVKYMDAPTIGATIRAGKALLESAFDPVQWPQFEKFLIDAKVPMPVIDELINTILKDQVGLPLDR